jgi:hypothetical protein
MAWVGIVLDLFVSACFLALPLLFHVNWYILLFVRPDFAVPVLVVGVCLGVLGLIKAATGVIHIKQSASSQEMTEAF